MSRVQRSSQMVPRRNTARSLAPRTKDKSDRPLWGGRMYSLGELGLRCMEERGGGERRRISCPHHKKSRNLMSNFAQHRVRSPPLLTPILCRKSENQSLFKLSKRGERRGAHFVSGQTLSFRLCAETISCHQPTNHRVQDGRRRGRRAIMIRYPPLKCCICFLFSQIRLPRSLEGLPAAPFRPRPSRSASSVGRSVA